MNVKEGDTVLIASLGMVRIQKLFHSGAANVLDLEGRTWLVTKELMSMVELGLFTMA